jgi:glyoxylase-like metal-dependent hydrolase (beta-lactamase superfamily II)
MTAVTLPASVKVIVRDWLCCNQVLLSSADGDVLIDSGHVTRAAETIELLRRPGHLGNRPLTRLINTHAHSDHIGGNAALKRAYGCPITVPSGEAAHIRAWDTRALWLDWAGQQAERFDFDDTLAPGETFGAGGLLWQALPAPGHDAGAVMFWCADEGILVSGDALWEHGFGIVLPDPPGGLEAARSTLERIAALDVRVVIPGHGRPFTDARQALERSFARLQAMQSDSRRAARSVLKAMFSFTLLERGRIPLDTVSDWLQGVPMYREYNERYLQLPPGDLAQWLIGELEKARVVRREGHWLVSADQAGAADHA